MSYQYKPKKTQIRVYVREDIEDILSNLADATGKKKGIILEKLLLESNTFINAKTLQEKAREHFVDLLKEKINI